MKIDIVEILDRGVANKERLYLKVNSSANLNYFVVFDNSFTTPNFSQISNLPKRAYWFPSKDVKPGDNIVLYTKSGNDNSVLNPNENYTHFFYWGLSQTIWNTENDCAVLFEVNSWQTSKLGK